MNDGHVTSGFPSGRELERREEKYPVRETRRKREKRKERKEKEENI